MIVYVDTSAALKLVVEERESPSTAEFLSAAGQRGDRLVASMLLHTELHCAANRRGLPADLVNAVLAGINLVDLTRSDLLYAAALPGRLCSADAIHLAAAIRLEAQTLVAFDKKLVRAATQAGLHTVAPGGG
ncbi:type II toxin-antitoxin system VapC family toxin [Pseudarthrobacter enclensis]|uniref:Nucleic acid-binding protein n=1 Tax=Pseudarthrobacter enclensis TaxID=993070 RepID=A0ABT9RVF5_9MICC|nr:type II toxin-antitoxin system VapC family toxin [Pseudarthrobacter enclensis]MDP9888299.1 putative nucleic acid-binding protein [Pseudarthrobacter enclensis]